MSQVDPNTPITNKTLLEAVDSILEGMDRLFKREENFNVKTFATKEDLKREISWVRDDIDSLKADLVGIVSKTEFNKLKSKVDKYLAV